MGKSIKLNVHSITAVTQKKTGQLGTGFMVRNEIKKNILSFEPYNERLCELWIKGKINNLSIISVHAPTEEKTDEKKKKSFMKTYK